MSGKLVGLFLILAAAIAGGGLYYLQIYGFYERVAATDAPDVVLTPLAGGAPEPIAYSGFQAIDADSSPIRFRACFETTEDLSAFDARFVAVADVTPRNAPGWFDCFDAQAIADDLRAGTARTFLGQKNIRYGVDQIVAITEGGRGYIWHELNDCGDKAYDGTVVGEECPPFPGTN